MLLQNKGRKLSICKPLNIVSHVPSRFYENAWVIILIDTQLIILSQFESVNQNAKRKPIILKRHFYVKFLHPFLKVRFCGIHFLYIHLLAFHTHEKISIWFRPGIIEFNSSQVVVGLVLIKWPGESAANLIFTTSLTFILVSHFEF